MAKHKIIRSGDEFQCSCGLTWPATELDPHKSGTMPEKIDGNWVDAEESRFTDTSEGKITYTGAVPMPDSIREQIELLEKDK